MNVPRDAHIAPWRHMPGTTRSREIERNYIRQKPLEDQVIAASKGNHGGRPNARSPQLYENRAWTC